MSAAVGPALGAIILWVADWHWLYVATVPVGCAVVATPALPFVAPHDGRLDRVSILLNCVVFGFIVLGAKMAAKSPILAAALFLTAALALVGLVRRERPKTRPLIPIDLLRSSPFSVSIIASMLCFTGQTAGLIALPFYLQDELGQAPAATGLYMIAWPLSVAVTAPFVGRMIQRFSTGWVCAIGATFLAAGLATIALWPLKGDPLLLVPFTVICGVGFGLFQVANNRTRSGCAADTQRRRRRDAGHRPAHGANGRRATRCPDLRVMPLSATLQHRHGHRRRIRPCGRPCQYVPDQPPMRYADATTAKPDTRQHAAWLPLPIALVALSIVPVAAGIGRLNLVAAGKGADARRSTLP